MNARIVVIRVIIMMRAGKMIVRIIVIRGVLAIVFHGLFVIVELVWILVFMFALVLENGEVYR